ncbi:MAG: DegV family protein [Lachnospiraceae bacterium]|nr:DegV family protein [Lachnospiraceae bacterium]
MFHIITDGSCDFTAEEIKQHNIERIPFYITFDEKNYLKEDIDISSDDYFNMLINDKSLHPKTSQPNPNDYAELYRPHLEAGKDILSLTISSKMSGSYNSASIAIDMLKEEYPKSSIILVDSANVSIGQDLILREIIKMRDEGFTLAKTARIAEEIKKTTRIYFTLDTLEYLKRGGRVGPTTALVGGILGLRPILQVENGEVSQLDNVRGKKKALKLIEAGMVEAIKDDLDHINISIGHILNQEEATLFKTNLEKTLNFNISNPVASIGAAVGTHAGPGAIAFTYCKQYNSFI